MLYDNIMMHVSCHVYTSTLLNDSTGKYSKPISMCLTCEMK
ncbi:hypothetical protein F383_25285 [Gossypium arboreum]|uniref:Uncharacterized protein n=1 Tax=Gossypium arboreum TaxID=29729 RepID=A0A0B0P5G2_GOSAR|nr:hypothetical protein F383_25285 [Gossypium arboreum]